MSAEHGHGGHEDNSITGIITSLILAFLGIPALLGVVEDTVQSVVNPHAAGH